MKLPYFHCLAASIAILSGCSQDEPQRNAFSEPVLSRQYRKESVTVIYSLSETNIPTSGKIQLMLDVHAPSADEVVFPEIEDIIEPFIIADGYNEPIQTLPNGKHLHRRVWTLLPNLPGENIFQPLEVQAGRTSIATDPVHISVTTLLPPDLNSLEIKDISAPVDLLPIQQRERRWTLNILLGLTGLISAWLLFRYRKTGSSVAAPLPHETAFDSLDNLPSDEIDKIHALVELLLIFIEDRFYIPTRGKTTREVLPLLAARWPKLNDLLIVGEQIRFSHKAQPGFAFELENFVRSFVENNKEAPCD